MKKLRHKISSIILSIAMVMAFLPTSPFNTVFAADPIDVTATGLDLSGSSVPLVQTTYKAGAGTIVWNPTTRTIGTGEQVLSGGTIVLNNATIDTQNNGIILPTGIANKTVDVSIILNGSNTIKTPSEIGITCNNSSGVYSKSLTISEDSSGGSLSIESKYAGIYLLNPITVQSGTLDIKSQKSGIVAEGTNHNVTINGGDINIVAIDNALQASSSDVNITGGNVTLMGQKSIQTGGKVALSGNAKIDTTNNIAIVCVDTPNALSDIFTKADSVTGTVNNVKIERLNIFGDIVKTYNMDGTVAVPPLPPTVTIDGVEYPLIRDITKTGINIAEPMGPQIPVAFKAGDGYVIYDPTTTTLTLYNATIDTPAPNPLINLPLKDVKIKLVGENFLANPSQSSDKITTLIEQGGSYNPEAFPSEQTPEDYSITVSGTGTLTTISKPWLNSISTLGTFIMESGTILNDAGVHPLSLNVIDFEMRGGSIVSLHLGIYGDATISGGTILITRGIRVLGDLTMSGGNVKCSSSDGRGISVLGTIKKTGGVLNSLVSYVELTTPTTGKRIVTMYDDVVAGEYNDKGNLVRVPRMWIGNLEGEDCCLNIPTGKTLTFPAYSSLDLYIPVGKSLSNYITNNGTFINNGEICLSADATKDDVMEVVRVLKPKGAGTIVIGHAQKIYSNSGEELNIRMDDLDLQNGEAVTGTFDGYSFTGNNTNGYTLTLNNLALYGSLILPSNVPVTIQTKASSIIDNGISFAGGYACNLTFTGSAPLTINGQISGGGTNSDIVNVQNDANVTINGRISIGGSGGAGGTLNVNGTRTTLNIFSDRDTGVYCGNVNVLNGANIITSSSSCGIFVNGGEVNVTKDSTLTTNCDYGVYIIDGKLKVDDTSKLITNGAIASFCIVDKTKAKTQSEVVTLPTLPKGTAIASAQGTDSGYGYTYWSLIPTGGELAVTDENSEPVTLIGAMKGILTFAKVTSGGGSNGNSGSGSVTTGEPEKPTTPVKPEKPKPIIPKPNPPISKLNPQTGDSIPVALPIMSIIALALMAVGLILKRKSNQ